MAMVTPMSFEEAVLLSRHHGHPAQ